MAEFNFGKNWENFSNKSLDENGFADAAGSLETLIGKDAIKGKTFLDIGSGSGLFSIAAAKIGAVKVTGIDISKESVDISVQNKKIFLPNSKVRFLHKSIFDEDISRFDKFDIVYSWGVLHHTGDMFRAIDISRGLVEKDGLFVIAIYNKHWSSPLWKHIKYFYNRSPRIVRWLMIRIFCCVIAVAKFVATGKNPFEKKRRGMSYYYDVIDWVGGYPYEYAGQEKITEFVKAKGFKLIKLVTAAVPTGCNEFVFQKRR